MVFLFMFMILILTLEHQKCNGCMKQQLETEPIEDSMTYHGERLSNSDDDDEESSDDEEYGNMDPVVPGSTYSGSTSGAATGNLIGDFEGLTFNDAASSTASTTNSGFWSPIHTGSAANRSAAGGRAVGGSVAGRPTSYAASVSSASTSTRGGYSSTGVFDAMKYGHPQAPSVADSMDTNRPTSSTASKWAKVRAYVGIDDPCVRILH